MSKVIVITGASDGIGAAAARHLVAAGHTVAIVGRDPHKTRAIANELSSAPFIADFARFDDVRRLAAQLIDAYPRIDVLANNAGGVFGDPARTVDGHEKTIQVNHLSPFLLTNLLMNTLKSSGASVIQTASAGARMAGPLDVNDLDNDRKFSAGTAYTSSKLANVLFTRELHVRGLAAAAFHPGGVATNLASESPSPMRFLYQNPLLSKLLTSADKAARQLLWLAEGTPGKDWQSGLYYEKHKPGRTTPQMSDDHLARRLWDTSIRLTGRRSAT